MLLTKKYSPGPVLEPQSHLLPQPQAAAQRSAAHFEAAAPRQPAQPSGLDAQRHGPSPTALLQHLDPTTVLQRACQAMFDRRTRQQGQSNAARIGPATEQPPPLLHGARPAAAQCPAAILQNECGNAAQLYSPAPGFPCRFLWQPDALSCCAPPLQQPRRQAETLADSQLQH